MVLGGTCETAGTKFYLGIRYSLRRNSKGGGLQQLNLILFYFNHEDELPPHVASTHGLRPWLLLPITMAVGTSPLLIYRQVQALLLPPIIVPPYQLWDLLSFVATTVFLLHLPCTV